jgi:hypothetical protein
VTPEIPPSVRPYEVLQQLIYLYSGNRKQRRHHLSVKQERQPKKGGIKAYSISMDAPNIKANNSHTYRHAHTHAHITKSFFLCEAAEINNKMTKHETNKWNWHIFVGGGRDRYAEEEEINERSRRMDQRTRGEEGWLTQETTKKSGDRQFSVIQLNMPRYLKRSRGIGWWRIVDSTCKRNKNKLP